MTNPISGMFNQCRRAMPEVHSFALIVLILGALGSIIAISPTLAKMLVALPVVLALYGAILIHWRWGIYGLLVYLPFAGLPTILLYPAPSITLLIKDLLFVIPAYLSFIIGYTRNRRHKPIFFVGAPIMLFSALAAIIFIHLFNPNLVNPLVGLIGLKVWLFYIPLYFLGYHLVDSKNQLFQMAKVILFTGTIPVTVGILQAIFIYTGYSNVVSDFYKPAEETTTQMLGGFVVGTGEQLVRIPSTFTFVTQYWTFLLCLFPISYAMWMKAKLMGQRNNIWYLLILGLIGMAGISSGARASLVMIPCYLLLLAIIGGGWKQALKPLILLILAVVILVRLLGTTTVDLFNFTLAIVGLYSSEEGGIYIEHSRVLDITWIGLGTGMSTGPARYALGLADETVDLVGLEGFYVKTIAEIGIPGLMIVVALFTQLLLNSYKAFACLQDRALRAFGAGILVFLFIQIIYSTKGAVLDFDPINVYFWLFAGILMKLPKLQASSPLVD